MVNLRPAHRLRRMWAWTLLGAAVLAGHLGVLEWTARSTPRWGGLTPLDDPDFNHALLPSDDAAARQAAADAAAQAAQLAQLAAPPSTVGQVLQARTLPPPPPPQPPPPPPSPSRKAALKPSPAAAPTLAPRQPPAPTPPASAPALPPVLATSAGETAAVDAVGLPPSVATFAPGVPAPMAPAPGPTAPPPASSAPPAPHPTSTTPAPAVVVPQNFVQKDIASLSQKDFTAPVLEEKSPSWLQAWPLSTRLSYQLQGQFRGPLYGDAQVQWQRQGEQYQAQVRISVGLFMNMRMTSQGRITPEQLWPLAYEEDRRGKKRGLRMGEQTVLLDNANTVPRSPGLQDTASQFVQLAQDFATGRRPLAVGSVVTVPLARPGGIDVWTYDVVAEDTVSTPLGALQAFHLTPRPLTNPRGTVVAEMWFAPALRHLPVRIRLTLNTETWLDLTLQDVSQSAP